MNKPPTGAAKNLLDRANKAKIPRAVNNNEPVKINPQIAIDSNKPEQHVDLNSEKIENDKKEETQTHKEEETKESSSINNVAPGQQKFMKRLQNSMKKFKNGTDTNTDSSATSTINTEGNKEAASQKKGMTKVIQSKKILDTAKLLENKMLKTESSESETHHTSEGVNINTEENKCLEEKKENNYNNNNHDNTESLIEDTSLTKSTVKTGVKKPSKKANI